MAAGIQSLLTYWFVGCLFVGLALGHRISKCPTENLPASREIVSDIAVWPITIGALIALMLTRADIPPTPCKVTS